MAIVGGSKLYINMHFVIDWMSKLSIKHFFSLMAQDEIKTEKQPKIL
jgi:hypothetical protein